jgi:DNA-binding XRE family transcriptional regulator
MTVQIIEIAGEKMALLPIAEYDRLLDVAEDKADALAAEEAERRRMGGEEYLPSELIDRIMAGESPLRVWRQYRGRTLNELATLTGLTHASLSRIESKKQRPKPAAWRALASALEVAVDDILPLD